MITALFDTLRNKNIHISLDGEELRLRFDGKAPEAELIDQIRMHKQEIIMHLKSLNLQATYHTIQPVGSMQAYPLSSSQKRLWLLCQSEDANIAYNMPGSFILQGSIHEANLEKALLDTIHRHEVFRTAFRMDSDGEVKQFIAPAIQPDLIAKADLSVVSDVYEAAKRMLSDTFRTPFDLTVGNLIRIKLIRLNADELLFSFVMHHIISDGWSMEVLLREFLHRYTLLMEGNTEPLPSLNIQYKDFSSWQQSELKSAATHKHRQYWIDKFSNVIPVLELPYSSKRPSAKTYDGEVVSVVFDATATTNIRAFSQTRNSTLFMVLLAGVKALLFRYSGQTDLVIGTPIAGRSHVELENQIGFYVNTLALRTQFSAADTFASLVDLIRIVTLEAFEHQFYPFDELVDEVYQTGDLSRNPLFDVAVVLQNTELDGNNQNTFPENISVRRFDDVERTISLFDLRFDFKEVGETLFVHVEFNSNLFQRDFIENLLTHLQQLLLHGIRQPEIPLAKLDLLANNEKQYLSQLLNRTHATYPFDKNLVELFEEQVALTPDAVALVADNQSYTYDQLNQQANRYAHFLVQTTKLQIGEAVGLLIDRKWETVVAILGTLKAGGMYIPMEISLPEERLKFIVNDTKMRVVFYEKQCLEKVNRILWLCQKLNHALCVDSTAVFLEKEEDENVMMSQELWDHVGQHATDSITGGGWLSSYTGQPIPEIEMEEYASNAYKKLEPYLSADMRVLEVGCSSGLTLAKVAPKVAFYLGTDLSPVILENTAVKIRELGINNVQLLNKSAHEIASIGESGFDLVIINSVIQHFHGHNYLRKVIADVIDLMNDKGMIFIGDIMDIDCKESLIANLNLFKLNNKGKGFITKTDFSADLFVSRRFFEDLRYDLPAITAATASPKLFTIENELTLFRYDTVLQVDKSSSIPSESTRHKWIYSSTALLQYNTSNLATEIDPSDAAYVIYTSGTTGQPKGVVVEHRNVVRLFKTEPSLFDFGSNDTWTMFHSYAFDFSVWELFGALLFGGKLIIVPKQTSQDPSEFLRLIVSEGVTVLNQTPSSFYQLMEEDWSGSGSVHSLRYVIFGGEALSPRKLKSWSEINPSVSLINMYGITETTVHVTYKHLTSLEMESDHSAIGIPIPTLSCYVLDDLGELVPVGVPGELYVGGLGVSRGYLGNAELTATRFPENPYAPGSRYYKTGDRVRITRTGELEYLGRKDDQVKVRGYRIELGEIENVLSGHEKISHCVVTVHVDVEEEKSLVCYYSLTDSLSSKELRTYLKQSLPDYMLPDYFVELESLPLTTNGKVDKKRLPSPFSSAQLDEVSYVAPKTTTEEILQGIWVELLGVQTIGTVDDFFELGGHSLKAMRLVTKIHQVFGIKVMIKTIFENPTISALAKEIDLINLVNQTAEVGTEEKDDTENFTF